MAAAYFFTPEVTEILSVEGNEERRTHWEIAQVVPLSLIVGSAGGAFLTAAQARVSARVKDESIQRQQAVTTGATEQLVEASRAAVAQAATEIALDGQPALTKAVHAAAATEPDKAEPQEQIADVQAVIKTATEKAIEGLDERLEEQGKKAQATIEAAASGTMPPTGEKSK